MSPHQTYSLDDIKSMLLGQLDTVLDRYAPRVEGSYESFGKYFTLNPGRADRSVGSFYVRLGGAKAGRWTDYATGQFGDVLDLIALSLGCDTRDALREARAFLGLQTASAEDVARRKAAADAAAKRRKEAEANDRADRSRRRGVAQRIFLGAREGLRGTPVECYLRDARGIDLSRLGRQPAALRYAAECKYFHMDQETGEIIEGVFPAMVAAICDRRGKFAGVHRTYLALNMVTGHWGKAPVPDAKKVYGDYVGAAINIWRGVGPRGGKPASLPKCAPGSHVYIAEGIEDALSCALLLPSARVIAAISLSNLGRVDLPENVAEVTLVADLDESAQAQAALARAVEQHRKAGRLVRLWQNPFGGKDLNDALLAAGKDNEKGAA